MQTQRASSSPLKRKLAGICLIETRLLDNSIYVVCKSLTSSDILSPWDILKYVHCWKIINTCTLQDATSILFCLTLPSTILRKQSTWSRAGYKHSWSVCSPRKATLPSQRMCYLQVLLICSSQKTLLCIMCAHCWHDPAVFWRGANRGWCDCHKGGRWVYDRCPQDCGWHWTSHGRKVMALSLDAVFPILIFN